MKITLKRALKTPLIAVCASMLVACVIFAEFFFGIALYSRNQSPARISLPELSGPYPVGRRYFDWIDSSRPDPFHKSAKRELMVAVWYPAQTGGSARTGSYLPGEWGILASRFQSITMRVRTQNFRSALLHNPIPRSVFRETKTHAVDDAIISEERPNFPVVLFLPGFSAMPTDYTALLEDIASHGYIVAGINPTDFVPVTVFDDGRKVYAPVWNPSLYDIEKGYAIWVRDMIFVLNQISAQNKDPRSPFFGHLDVMSVGAFGHSFGGAASAGACHLDPRIRAGMNLDGAFHGDRSTWTFAQPFMLVQSQTRAYRDSGAEAFYAGLSTGYRAVINGSTHHAFMDEAFLPVFGDRRATLLGSVPGPRMVQITSSLVRAFFDAYLQNKPSALNHISSQFPEITVTKKQHETSTDSRRPNSLR